MGNFIAYDDLDRPSTITHADGSSLHYSYGATGFSTTDENGHTTVYDRLAFGSPSDARVAAVHDATSQVWTYSYNAFGSLTQVAQPGGTYRTWSRDTVTNRVMFETQPESGTTSFQYSLAGRLAWKKDAKNQEFTYSYDPSGRINGVDGPGTEFDLGYQYDERSNLAAVLNNDPNQVRSYFEYDNANRLTNRRDEFIGRTFNTHLTYDGNDNVTDILYPSGHSVHYNYGLEGRVTSVTGPEGIVYAQGGSYYPFGQMASFQYGNGLWRSQTFDHRHRLWYLQSGPLSIQYDYDGANNVTSVYDWRPGFAQSFGYDALDRLTDVSGYQATTFTYDPLGNRLTKPGSTYQYDPGSLRLSQVTGVEADFSIQYDANGNLTQDGQGQYLYRPDNLMREAITNNGSTTYTYDGDGQRFARSNASGTAVTTVLGGRPMSTYGFAGEWLYDSIYLGSELIATLHPPTTVALQFESMLGEWWTYWSDEWRSGSMDDNGDGTFRITYPEDGFEGQGILWNPEARTFVALDYGWVTGTVSANGRKITFADGRVWMRSPNEPDATVGVDYVHVDALGSVRAVSDMAGNVLATYDYGVFGEGPDVSASGTKQRFAGTERDGETFLDHMGARYHRNVLGRFTQADDSRFMAPHAPQSMNQYAYAYNNPLRWVDPTGHTGQSPTGNQGQSQEGGGLIGQPRVPGTIILVTPTGTREISQLQFFWQSWLIYQDQRRAEVMEHWREDAAAGRMTVLGAPLMPPALRLPGILTRFLPFGRAAATIDTGLVRFTQSSVSRTLRTGEGVNEVISALRGPGGKTLARGFDPIRIFEQDGQLLTLDNRRLLIFSQAGLEVPFVWATRAEIAAESWKFTSTAEQIGGWFIRVR